MNWMKRRKVQKTFNKLIKIFEFCGHDIQKTLPIMKKILEYEYPEFVGGVILRKNKVVLVQFDKDIKLEEPVHEH